MTFSAISAFLALFSKQPTHAMDIDGFNRLCKSTARYTVDDFLHILLCEAVQAESDPSTVLDRFVVDKVSQEKVDIHEFLIIDTHDTQDSDSNLKNVPFLLERMMSKNNVPASKKSIDPHDLNVRIDATTEAIYTPNLFEKVKQLVESFVRKSEDHLSSLEEGLSSSSTSVASSLSMTDGFTASVSEAADAASEAVDESLERNRNLAVDRISGRDHIKPESARRKLRHFYPSARLTLFEFVMLAYTVHKLYPYYTKLGKQCLFLAGLTYEALELYCREASTNIDVAHPSLGCWNGVKITNLDPKLVFDVVTLFKRTLARQHDIVSLRLFDLFSLTDTLYIDREAGSV
jgi:hypothetical protein